MTHHHIYISACRLEKKIIWQSVCSELTTYMQHHVSKRPVSIFTTLHSLLRFEHTHRHVDHAIDTVCRIIPIIQSEQMNSHSLEPGHRHSACACRGSEVLPQLLRRRDARSERGHPIFEFGEVGHTRLSQAGAQVSVGRWHWRLGKHVLELSQTVLCFD